MSITVKQVTAAQLAQARGCKPQNVCWLVCVEQAQNALDVDGPDAVSEYQLEWINDQFGAGAAGSVGTDAAQRRIEELNDRPGARERVTEIVDQMREADKGHRA